MLSNEVAGRVSGAIHGLGVVKIWYDIHRKIMARVTDDPRSALRKLQSVKLRRLLTQILPQNPFYTRKFAAAGVDPASVSGCDDLPLLPLTTKAELQAAQGGPHGPNAPTYLTYGPERYVRLHQTSGSTGKPIRWLDTRESWDAILQCWQIIYDGAEVSTDDRFFFPFSFGPFIGFWAAFDAAVARGNLCVPGGGLSSAARLRWIVDDQITVLACTPTYALRLAEVARLEGIDIQSSAVRALIVAGEPGGSVSEVCQRLETAWGARCFDHWGMTEVGPIAFEPRDRPGGLHVIETNCIAEFIDPATGESLEGPGRGELVITTLERLGSPVIRYRTGDVVDVSGDVAVRDSKSEQDVGAFDTNSIDPLTGAPFLRLEGGILARTDHMVLIGGNNIYPAAIDAVARQFDDIVEYQAEVVRGPAGNRLRVRVELAPEVPAGATKAFATRFAGAFQDRFFFRPDVEIVEAGSLPRFELKAQRFIIREEDTKK